jgi:hypothetical protein
MRTTRSKDYACPRCGYRLAPVFARKRLNRSPIGHCCPEPYCDYVQHARVERMARPRAKTRAIMSRAG